jgi:acyl-ACP thioesterase
MLYRDFDLFVDGEPVGEAVSAWVLADADSRRLLKMSTVEDVMRTGGGELCKQRKLAKVRMRT